MLLPSMKLWSNSAKFACKGYQIYSYQWRALQLLFVIFPRQTDLNRYNCLLYYLIGVKSTTKRCIHRGTTSFSCAQLIVVKTTNMIQPIMTHA